MADQIPKPTTRWHSYCCIPVAVDKSCLIFATLSAIKWAIFATVAILDIIQEPSQGLFILFILFFAAFVFSLVLFKGTRERRPDLVRIYMVFAAVLVVLILGLVIIFALLIVNIVACLIAVFFLIAYTRSLLVVKATYELFLSEKIQNADQLLALEAPMKAYSSMEASAPAPEKPPAYTSITEDH